MREHGREIVMIGHRGHPEVEGTMGQSGGGMYLVEKPEDVPRLGVKDEKNLAFVTQTTLSVDDAQQTINALKARFPGIVGPKKDDICYATQNRQDAVKALARQCEVVIVVGSPNSSNSNRLREVARAPGRAGLHGGQRLGAQARVGGGQARRGRHRRRLCARGAGEAGGGQAAPASAAGLPPNRRVLPRRWYSPCRRAWPDGAASARNPAAGIAACRSRTPQACSSSPGLPWRRPAGISIPARFPGRSSRTAARRIRRRSVSAPLARRSGAGG